MFVSQLNPIAFSLGPLSIRWYGILFSFGFILGYIIMQLFFRKKGYKTISKSFEQTLYQRRHIESNENILSIICPQGKAD